MEDKKRIFWHCYDDASGNGCVYIHDDELAEYCVNNTVIWSAYPEQKGNYARIIEHKGKLLSVGVACGNRIVAHDTNIN